MVFRAINKCVGMVVFASCAMDMPGFGLLAKLGLELRHIRLLLHT